MDCQANCVLPVTSVSSSGCNSVTTSPSSGLPVGVGEIVGVGVQVGQAIVGCGVAVAVGVALGVLVAGLVAVLVGNAVNVRRTD